MIIFGTILWLLLLAIVIAMWRRMRGYSFNAWIDRDAHEHHVVQHMLSQHPNGGEYSQVTHWLTAAESESCTPPLKHRSPVPTQ